jgi:hypothetical protein
MRILDSKKDYYDHHCFDWGQPDKSITFVRTASKKLTDDNLLRFALWKEISGGGWRRMGPQFILEAGFIQFLFEVRKVSIKKVVNPFGWDLVVNGELILLKRFDENVHIFEKELTLVNDWKRKYESTNWRRVYAEELKSIKQLDFKQVEKDSQSHIIELPILGETQIPGVIPSMEVYTAIDNFISAKNNDVDVSIPITDIDKAINHGFDKKASFRHPIKV